MDNDTDNMKAFDLVTEALENLDALQEPSIKNLLTQDSDSLSTAETLLSQASELDHDYFKAKYFHAMVTYLNSGREKLNIETQRAIDEFRNLSESLAKESGTSVRKKSVARELSYNRAAALFEGGRYSEAISLFEITVEESSNDPEVNLLASAGAALAYAARAVQESEKQSQDKDAVKKHYRYIRNELAPIFLPPLIPLLRLIRGKKPVDKQIADRIRKIIKLARMSAKTSSPPRPETFTDREKALG